MAPNKQFDSQEHFRKFTGSLAIAIEACEEDYADDMSAESIQRSQLEELTWLEDKWRDILIRHRYGPNVYRKFVTYITEENRNVLSARPYFRERHNVFFAEISKALKKRDAEALYQFHVNYMFIGWVLKSRKWAPKSPITVLARRIEAIRHALVEMNTPLAISRARIFWSRTSKSHLTFMDFVQIAIDGLLSAIDKYEMPYTTAFRGVAIGRMVGNFINAYSKTFVHFSSSDQRKLYRAHKAISRYDKNEVDFEDLAARVNEGAKNGGETNASEIQHLLSAASYISGETLVTNQSGDEERTATTLFDVIAADDHWQPDCAVENAEVLHVLAQSVRKLPIIHQKVLIMRGIAL